MKSPLTRRAIAAIVLVVLLPAALVGATYDFYSVADTTGPYSSLGFAPAMNNSGTVAFIADRLSDGTGIYTVASSGATTTIAKTNGTYFKGFSSYLSLNNLGDVAFKGSTASTGIAYYVGDGGTPDEVVESSSTFSLDIFPVLNDSRQLAFRAWEGINRDKHSIYLQSAAGFKKKIYDVNSSSSNVLSPPSLSNNGHVAFGGSGVGLGEFSYGLFTYDGTNLEYQFAYPVTAPGSTDHNDNGDVAFISLVASQTEEFQLLPAGQSTPITLLEENGSTITGFAVPDINADGTYALTASSSGGDSAIYTGSGGAIHRVIGNGDSLFGATVSSVFFARGGLNDSGEMAFSYTLDNGVTGVATATLVPEPGSVALIVTGSLAALIVCFRRRRSQVA